MSEAQNAAHGSLIQQQGVAERVAGDRVFVRIYQNASCEGCAANGSCSSKSLSESSSRLVEASYQGEILPGSRVILEMNTSDGLLSVFLSFLLPLILLFVFILSFQSRGISEPLLALGSLGVLALYYMGLALFRRWIARRISFRAVPAEYSQDDLNGASCSTN